MEGHTNLQPLNGVVDGSSSVSLLQSHITCTKVSGSNTCNSLSSNSFFLKSHHIGVFLKELNLILPSSGKERSYFYYNSLAALSMNLLVANYS